MPAYKYLAMNLISSTLIKITLTLLLCTGIHTRAFMQPLFFHDSGEIGRKQSTPEKDSAFIVALPAPWKHLDIGSPAIPGQASFDGKRFTLEGAGTYADSTTDQCQFAYIAMETQGEITVRIIPQASSQFARMGLMMRESLKANAAEACVFMNVGKTDKAPASEWYVTQMAREIKGKPLQLKNIGEALSEPIVTHGSLTGQYWLRLQRKFNSFYAFTSLDGKSWVSVGRVFVEMNKKFFAGIGVSSGLKTVTSTVIFDNIGFIP
jgi:hypothetical protein